MEPRSRNSHYSQDRGLGLVGCDAIRMPERRGSNQRSEIRRQRTEVGGQRSEVRGKKKEERDSPVGAAFSRDLAL
jgi:hypothetical protein